MEPIYAIVIGLAVIVLFLGALVFGLLRGHAEVLRRLDAAGLRLDDDQPVQLGPRAPSDGNAGNPLATTEIVGIHPDGSPAALSLVAGSDPVLLAFLSTSCSSCTVFWEALDGPFLRIDSGRYRVVLVTLSEDEESPTRAEKLSSPGAEVVMSSQGWGAFEVPGAPYFLLLDPASGTTLGEGTASTFDSLVEFLNDSAGDRAWEARVRDRTDRDRADRIDNELKNAGIEPGDARLYHTPGEVADG